MEEELDCTKRVTEMALRERTGETQNNVNVRNESVINLTTLSVSKL